VFRRLLPFLFLSGLALVFFYPLVLHPSHLLYSGHSDMLAMHVPMKRFLVRSWQETGELPLWCPYSFCGVPFIHDVQVAAFYPLHWPLFLLPEEYVGAGMSWLVVLHVMIAGWCMLAYARADGLGEQGALIAAVGYMFAGKWLLHLLASGHYIMIPLAWLPLAVLFLERAVRQDSARWFVADAVRSGVFFALIVLGSHPQMTLYAGLFMAAWPLGAARPLRKATVLSWLGAGMLTVFVASGLAAVQLLPALEATPYSTRSIGVSPADILAAAPYTLLALVGPPWSDSWEDRGGLDVLWVALALTAPLVGKAIDRWRAGIAVSIVVFALGGAVLFQSLPVFRLFQIQGRILMLLALPVALLAGRTVEALLDAPALRGLCLAMIRRVLIVSVALVIASIGIAWPNLSPGHGILYLAVLFCSLAAAYLLLRHGGAMHRIACGRVWLCLLLADAWAMSLPLVAGRPQDAVYPIADCVSSLVSHDAGEHWRVLDRGLPGDPASAALSCQVPLLGQIRLESVLGYNTFDVRRTKEFLQFVSGEEGNVVPREGNFGFPIVNGFPIKKKTLLDLLGVKYLLMPAEPGVYGEADGEPGKDKDWKPTDAIDRSARAFSFLAGHVTELPPYRTFENTSALPRAFVVHTAAPTRADQSPLHQLTTTDFRKVVLIDREVAEQPSLAVGQDDNEAVRIEQYGPNHIRLHVTLANPGWLVLTNVDYPGWSCKVEDAAVPISQADYLFMCIPVQAGEHAVRFDFLPRSYEIGKWLSLAMVAVVAISLARGLLFS
jgi:hypothetical protein